MSDPEVGRPSFCPSDLINELYVLLLSLITLVRMVGIVWHVFLLSCIWLIGSDSGFSKYRHGVEKQILSKNTKASILC